ncbi:MAG: site-specific integrase [Candidatus Tectomicrobia bacterium]|nr:site-specific integrase [Candidatus Tectomicrobia bacterium]
MSPFGISDIRRQRRRIAQGHRAPRLWCWGRTQAYQHVKAAMRTASIEGPHATPKGLRHGFGVRAAAATRQPRLVQKWLGHRSLDTTAIYMDAQDEEERELAARMWQ